MSDNQRGTSAAGRRWFFGTNVTVMIIFAAALVMGVNYIGKQHSYRSDVAAGVAGHRLSDRTRQILAEIRKADDARDIRVTTVYISDDPETSRREYFPRLRDLAEEIRHYDRGVVVQHLRTGDQRAELRDRIHGKFEGGAKDYNEVIQQAEAAWNELTDSFQALRQEIAMLIADNAWISDFPPLAKISSDVERHRQSIEETRREVNDLVRSEGIPRFEEANRKIKAINDEVIRDLEAAQGRVEQWQRLVDALLSPDSEFAAQTRERANLLVALKERLKQGIGDPTDQALPEDPRAAIQEFARAASSLAAELVDEADRVNAFVRENPAITQHPRWTVQVQQMIFVQNREMPWLLSSTAEQLAGVRQTLRQQLATDPPADVLATLVRRLREVAVEGTQGIDLWARHIMGVLEDGRNIDESSRDFIGRGSRGELFKPMIDRLRALDTAMEELPELDLDEVATRLQEDNIVVLEVGDRVKVLSFDEVWPIADPMAMQMGDEAGAHRRIFDGDTAIGGALLGLQSEDPIATVIFVGYEPPPVSPMMGGGSGAPLPFAAFSILREKLEQANFAVKEWNLAEEDASRPEPEAGTRPVYVFLPPGKTQQNPMMGRQQPPPQQFGPAELAMVRRALEDGGRAIFLTFFQFSPPSPFFPPPIYEYEDMLREDWGIEVDIERRVIRGLVDRSRPGRFSINVTQWMHMQLSNFTDHPIGRPLRARRMLMRDVCPVVTADEVPEGVQLREVLTVPSVAHDIWAERQVGRIINELLSGQQDSTFEPSDDAWKPPFSVMVAGEREDPATRIVVMGTAVSLVDSHLAQRVMRIEGRQSRLVTDPPPLENVDLFINALYWLSDQEQLIAAGPAELPVVEPMDESERRNLLLLSLGWAFLVLIAGGVVMIVRRR